MQSPDVRTLRSDSSSFSVKAAVSGMKCLLPLRLTSTFDSVPDVSSAAPAFNQTTFEPEDSPKKISPRSKKLSHRGLYFPQIPLVIRPEQYRDTPVYTDAGSPIPGQAYYPQFDFWRKFSSSISSSDEDECVSECSSPNTLASDPEYQDCVHMSITKPKEVQCFEQSPTSGQTGSCRNSDMSFKCLGDDQFVHEPNEIIDSFDEKSLFDSRCLPDILADNMPPNYVGRGWIAEPIRENIIEEDESDITTPPMTPKTKSLPVHEPIPNSPLTIPPRSSSFIQTRTRPSLYPLDIDAQPERKLSQEDVFAKETGHERYQDSFDDSYSLPEEEYSTSASTSSKEVEPPIDDQALKYRVGTARVQSLFGHHNHNPVTGSLVRSHGDTALTVVEDLVRYFPFHPSIDFGSHISTVRTQLHLISAQQNKYGPGAASSPQERQPPDKKWSRARRLTASISSLTKSTTDTTPSTPTFPSLSDSPIYDPTAHIDITPLQRIFPSSAPTVIQPLYAYLLGYILILEIRTITRLNQRTRSLVKATRMLGVPLLPDKPPTANDHIDQLVFAKRVDAVIASLQNSIYCLVTAMEPDAGNRNGARGFIDGCFGRCLLELVEGCEDRVGLVGKCNSAI
ncbi:hypothetical protein GLAREA_12084 [Glarea lozoyensis ATCC 20868]|uniref:Uncharacterized protein n=1 Tax=Glarea lozoyensis (strain ATCC 20868 / MF5171) TaxID=1116229 RepID=S3D0E2_GLAL2|nr:uncharacterized protein GLAREA_12084 [Glarea lozoyensis ATCC 20868]EPE32002.1 hypothetical protein GLAREA_12084 [Glarea lozoyensis ATCC 20868]